MKRIAADLRGIRGALQAGRYAEAEAALEPILRAEPGHHEAHFLSGICALRQGDLARALAALHSASALNRNAVYHFQYAAALEAAGRLPEAIHHFRESARLDPKFAAAHYNLGALLQHQGDHDGALRCYRNALLHNPSFAEALNNLGALLTERGEYAQAQDALRRAIAVQPALPMPHNNLGNTLARQGKVAEAIESYDRALAIAPDFAEALFNCAEQLQVLGDRESATAMFQRLLAVAPNHPAGRFALDVLASANPAHPPDDYVRNVSRGLAEKFDSHLVGTLGYRIPKILRAELEPLLAMKAPIAALDLGCGTGLFGMEIRAWCGFLKGVDLSPEMLTKARQRSLYDELQTAEIGAALAIEARRYDLVSATDVFVYVGALEPVMAGAARVLKAGGLLACSLERLDAAEDYRLRSSGRYAHSLAYAERVGLQFGLRSHTVLETPIRTEADAAIPGYAVIFEKG